MNTEKIKDVLERIKVLSNTYPGKEYGYDVDREEAEINYFECGEILGEIGFMADALLQEMKEAR